jgi:hypothetical protein
MAVTLKPFEQRPEFIPVLITSTGSSVAQSIKLDQDDNLGPGYYTLSVIGTEHNYKSTKTTLQLHPYADAAQTIVSNPLWMLDALSTVAVSSYSFATVNSTTSDSASGYHFDVGFIKSDATMQGDTGRGIFLPYGLKATVTNNVSSTIRLDLIAQRKA